MHQRLTTPNVETLTIDGELQSLDAALAEAALRLESVQRDEAQAESKKNAMLARSNYKKTVENGSKIAERLLAASMLLTESKRLFDENHQLGYAHCKCARV